MVCVTWLLLPVQRLLKARLEKMGLPTRKKSVQQKQEPPVSIPDLPFASDRLKDDPSAGEEFEIIFKKEYDSGRGVKEGNDPSLIESVDNTEALRQRLIDEISMASREELLEPDRLIARLHSAAGVILREDERTHDVGFEAIADDIAVGEIFRKARDGAGISLRAASKKAGKNTHSQLSNLENGRVSSSIQTLSEFAEAIGFEVRVSLKPR